MKMREEISLNWREKNNKNNDIFMHLLILSNERRTWQVSFTQTFLSYSTRELDTFASSSFSSRVAGAESLIWQTKWLSLLSSNCPIVNFKKKRNLALRTCWKVRASFYYYYIQSHLLIMASRTMSRKKSAMEIGTMDDFTFTTYYAQISFSTTPPPSPMVW